MEKLDRVEEKSFLDFQSFSRGERNPNVREKIGITMFFFFLKSK